MPVPTDVSGVKRLLGMVQFLARFVPHLSETVHPIQTLVNKEHSWHWGPEQDSAFAKVKDALSAEPVLKHYNPKLPLVVQADASKNALGAAMLQEGHPLAYASRSLTSSEQNYCQMEKELLSVQFAMEKFHQYTYGRHVIVQNDHKPLVATHRKPIAAASLRIQRMLLRLQNYTYTFVHVPGKDLHLADTLSRACTEDPPIEETDPLEHILNSVVVTDLTDAELTELQSATARDLHYSQLTDIVMAGWPENKKDCPSILTPFWDYRDEITVCQQVLLKGRNLMIPAPFRHKYRVKAHNAHLGAESSIRRAKQSIFWPSMSADIRAAVQKCEICARAAPNQQKQPLQQPEIPTTAWHTVSADIFTLDKKDYLVTVDSLSGFFEVDRSRTLTTAETILKLTMIFACFGCPHRLITDNARQFTSKEFATFAQNWRFEHKTSSPHYARSNRNGRKCS